MAKVKGAIITASVSEVAVAGRLNEEGKIDARLICGAKDLILTLDPEAAKQLGQGLLHAVAQSEKAKR